MNKNILLIGLAVVGFYLYSQSKPGGAVVLMSSQQKRNSIITYWQTFANPDVVATDNGRFADIINGISPGEIDTIYSYVFDYIEKNIAPPAALATKMQAIQSQYNILTS